MVQEESNSSGENPTSAGVSIPVEVEASERPVFDVSVSIWSHDCSLQEIEAISIQHGPDISLKTSTAATFNSSEDQSQDEACSSSQVQGQRQLVNLTKRKESVDEEDFRRIMLARIQGALKGNTLDPPIRNRCQFVIFHAYLKKVRLTISKLQNLKRRRCNLCSVLFQPSNDVAIRIAICRHLFHRHCFNSWLRISITCPAPNCFKHIMKDNYFLE